MALNNHVENFTLDMAPGGIAPVLNVSQGDTGRAYTADMYWGGASYDVSGLTVRLRGRKRDNTVFDYALPAPSGTKVAFDLEEKEQITIIPGNVECELVFTDSDSRVVGTGNFVIIVEEAPYDPNAISESEVTGLVDLISDQIGGAVDDWMETEAPTSTVFADAINNATAEYITEHGVTVPYLEEKIDEITEPGVNLFDVSEATDGYIINRSGEVATYSGYSVSGYIPVNELTPYTFSIDGSATTNQVRRLIYLNASKERIGDIVEYPTTVTTPASCAYIQFAAPTSVFSENLQLEHGSLASPYEPYELYPKGVPELESDVAKLENDISRISKASINLYDKASRKENKLINSQGAIIDYTGYCVSDYIPVEEESVYTFSLAGAQGNYVRRMLYCDGNKATIGTLVEYPQTFTTPANCEYIIFTADNNTMVGELQLEAGGVVHAYEEYGTKVKENPLEKISLENFPEASENNFCFTDDDGLLWSNGYAWRKAKDNTLAIKAKSYCTILASNGSLIASKDKDVVSLCGSMTKVLSALVTAMYVDDLSVTVSVSESDAPQNVPYYINAGEIVTYEALLNSSLIQSDNNAADALARPVGYIINPSAASDNEARNAFFAKMGEVAGTLGMSNTSVFTSAHSNMQSTPADMCKLFKHINDNYPELTTIWKRLSYTITTLGENSRSWTITSTTDEAARRLIPEFDGGKTGTTTVGSYGFVWKDKNTEIPYITVEMDISGSSDAQIKKYRFAGARQCIDEVYGMLS